MLPLNSDISLSLSESLSTSFSKVVSQILSFVSVIFNFFDTSIGVIFKKIKTLCDIEGEISNWTNWHNFGRKIMSIWYIFQIQLLSAIYEDKIFFFNFYWQQSVKMITNTDLLPQRYHFFLGMVKDLNVFPFDNDMKKAHFGTKLCIYH